MNNQNHLDDIQDFLDSIPEKLVASKSTIQISPEEHKAYIAYHDQVDLDGDDLRDLLKKIEDPSKGRLSTEEKKQLLFLLAHEGSLEAFRMLEEHLDQVEEGLKGWTTLCLEECRNLLESDLLEEDRAMVMTGMGGEGHRLRYAIVLSPKKGLKFDKKEKETLRKVVGGLAEGMDSVLEVIEFEDHYALLTILISMEVPVDDVMMGCIKHFNEKMDFLRIHYYSTNIHKPNVEEVEEYLGELE